jgi:hypothetical protein
MSGTDQIFTKRRPRKPERSNSAVYVSSKTTSKALLDRCNQLINKGEKEITIYCLGAVIQKGILLALKVCEQHVAFKIHTNTFTTELLGNVVISMHSKNASLCNLQII